MDFTSSLKPDLPAIIGFPKWAVKNYENKNALIFNSLRVYGIYFENKIMDIQKCLFVKNNPNDKIFWVDNPDTKGEFLFSFDKERVFNLFADYPYKLTKHEKEIFDEENPYWKDFFKDRQ